MSIFLLLLTTLIALLLLIPTLVFVTEVFAGCLLPVPEINYIRAPRDKRVAVLIPAHNEGAGVAPTIEDIKLQLRTGDRLVVVADNCSDNTAEVAASMGAEVSARIDPTKIGKGYALDWGIRYLTAGPPDIVIVIDADSRIQEGTIEKLFQECEASGRPVQALYLMEPAPGSPIKHQVAQFAWRVKNLIRPLGLLSLNMPCQLMGTGMAFPWAIIQSADLKSGFIVEDMKLGLEFAAKGQAPRFCPSAIVTSTFPTSMSGTRAQRQRWEQGHISLILSDAPKLLLKGLRKGDLKLCAAALDLAVPPLSLLVAILAVAAIATALTTILGLSEKPFLLIAACLFLVMSAILLAWIKHGRDDLPLNSVILIVPYLAKKISLYAALAAGRRVSRWIRTDRS